MRRFASVGICYSIFICLSVCLSVGHTHAFIKMAKHFIEILLPPDSPIILVFHHLSLLNSDDFITNGGTEYKGVRKLGCF